MPRTVRGAIPSPNIWKHPDVYEIENRGVDPDGVLERAMRERHDWSGATVLDIGCGTGFHLPGFAESATRVIGVEPHADLIALARRRCAGLADVEVRAGVASALPVDAASVDVAHARWAYFFGPGTEPGLTELDRVMRRGGTAFIIDNDVSRSTFSRWFRSAYPCVKARVVEAYFSGHGWTRTPLDMRWQFDTRADFEAVVRIEFPAGVAERVVAEHAGTGVDYAINLWSKDF
jgi:SAM-dependent methyltransferase